MYKNRFAVNNLQWLIYDQTRPNQTKLNYVAQSTGYEEYANFIFLDV